MNTTRQLPEYPPIIINQKYPFHKITKEKGLYIENLVYPRFRIFHLPFVSSACWIIGGLASPQQAVIRNFSTRVDNRRRSKYPIIWQLAGPSIDRKSFSQGSGVDQDSITSRSASISSILLLYTDCVTEDNGRGEASLEGRESVGLWPILGRILHYRSSSKSVFSLSLSIYISFFFLL